MFIKDGKRFNIDAAHVIDGEQILPGTLRNDPTKRAALGITEIADPARGNDEFYYNQEIDDAPYLIVTPKPLDQVKALVWEKIKAHRDTLQGGGYQVDTKWFHSDEKSKIQQLGLVLAGANLPPNLQWKTMDGTFVTMTQALAGQIFGEAVAHETAVFAKAEEHRAAVNALTTVDDIAAYDWKTGWPAVYEAGV